MTPPPHRHASSRNQWMEGLNFENMNSAFGKVGVAILVLTGILLIASTKRVSKSELSRFEVEVTGKPYQPTAGSNTESILIPVNKGEKLIRIDDLAFKAADTVYLKTKVSIGDSLTLWLDQQNSQLFQKVNGGKQIAVLLMNCCGHDIISEDSYNHGLGLKGRIGWWIIVLGSSMLPYFFISRPAIKPIWVFLALLAAMVAWFRLFG